MASGVWHVWLEAWVRRERYKAVLHSRAHARTHITQVYLYAQRNLCNIISRVRIGISSSNGMRELVHRNSVVDSAVWLGLRGLSASETVEER